MRKLRKEYTQRYDGKFNLWRKIDIHPEGEDALFKPPHYGDWEVVGVYATRDEARAAYRALL